MQEKLENYIIIFLISKIIFNFRPHLSSDAKYIKKHQLAWRSGKNGPQC